VSRSKGWIRWTGLLTVDLTALLAGSPHWSQLAADLLGPHRWIDRVGTDEAALTLTTAALWCVALWLAVGLAALALATWPGLIGVTARRLAARLLPAVLLRAVAGMAGLGVLVAPIAPLAAGADTPPHPAPAASAVVRSPSWPTTPGPPSGPRIGWPTDHAPTPGPPNSPRIGWPTDHAPAPRPPRPPDPPTHPRSAGRHADQALRPPTDESVRVQPGDSLWLIAARRLGPAATDEQIAANWPRWYAANRSLIGDDPSLIEPGQVLQAPQPSDTAR
jgi:hypothetical protein